MEHVLANCACFFLANIVALHDYHKMKTIRSRNLWIVSKHLCYVTCVYGGVSYLVQIISIRFQYLYNSFVQLLVYCCVNSSMN